MGKNFLIPGILFWATHLAAAPRPDLESRYQALQNDLRSLHSKYTELLKEISELQPRFIDVPNVCEGRLTTESGVPLSTSDRSNQSTLYFTPYKGGMIALYTGTQWLLRQFTEKSLALSGLTSGKNYDVFAYDNSGTVALELSAAWSTNLVRTDALALQDGIYVKSGTPSRRYLGTFRATASNQTQDTLTQRLVWNYQNRLRRPLLRLESTNTWTYNSASWRAANGSTTNIVEYVVGLDDVQIEARVMVNITNSTGALNYYAAGIGIDSTTTNSAQLRGSGSNSTIVNQVWGEYRGYPGLGYHYLQWLENAHASTITVWGDNGDNTQFQSGMTAELEG